MWFLVQHFCQVCGSHLISLLYICLGVQKITVCRRELLNTMRLGQQQGGGFPHSDCWCFLGSDFILTLTCFGVSSNTHKCKLSLYTLSFHSNRSHTCSVSHLLQVEEQQRQNVGNFIPKEGGKGRIFVFISILWTVYTVGRVGSKAQVWFVLPSAWKFPVSLWNHPDHIEAGILGLAEGSNVGAGDLGDRLPPNHCKFQINSLEWHVKKFLSLSCCELQ